MRTKQGRWQLTGDRLLRSVKATARQSTPAWQARRSLHNLRLLSDLVPPRVQSAVLGTIWNRWCTARRFQGSAACVFRCATSAEDSIEHYCRCPITLHVASRYLRLGDSHVNMHTLSLCNPLITTQDALVASALLIYAVYRGTNHYRHQTAGEPQEVYDSLRQWIREGVGRHGASHTILRNLWAPGAVQTALPAVPAHLPARVQGPVRLTTQGAKQSHKRCRSETESTTQVRQTRLNSGRTFRSSGMLSVAEVTARPIAT